MCRVGCRTRGQPGRERRRLGGGKNAENDVDDIPLCICVVKRVGRVNTKFRMFLERVLTFNSVIRRVKYIGGSVRFKKNGTRCKERIRVVVER